MSVAAAGSPAKPDIRLVLEHYGWDGRATGYGSWRNTRCPFHGDDRNPSGRVNEDEGFFHCHMCGVSGDAFEVVKSQEQCDFLRAKDLVREWTGFDLASASNDYHRRGDGASTGHSGHQRLVNSKLPAWAVKKHSRKLV